MQPMLRYIPWRVIWEFCTISALAPFEPIHLWEMATWSSHYLEQEDFITAVVECNSTFTQNCVWVHISATCALLKYFYFMQPYSSSPLHLKGKYLFSLLHYVCLIDLVTSYFSDESFTCPSGQVKTTSIFCCVWIWDFLINWSKAWQTLDFEGRCHHWY